MSEYLLLFIEYWKQVFSTQKLGDAHFKMYSYFFEGEGILAEKLSVCFSCKDMYHGSLCDRVKTCNNEEVEYVKRCLWHFY